MGKTDFLPAYLVLGEDELKRLYVLERLEKRLAAMGDLDFNKDVFSAGDADPGELVSSCNILPFACDYRLIVVKDAQALSKDASEAIIGYLASPCPTTILVLEATKLKKSTRLYKAISNVGKKAVIDCSPRKSRDVPLQARDFAAAHGVTLTPRASQLLVDLVGESTTRLDSEIQKLASQCQKGDTISYEQVAENVSRSCEPKPWFFIDALGKRDAKRCLSLLSQMKSQTPYAILSRCVFLLRDLLIAHELRDSGVTALSGALHRPEWQARNTAAMAENFSASELRSALVCAAKVDASMKSGGNPDMAFEQWVLYVCRSR